MSYNSGHLWNMAVLILRKHFLKYFTSMMLVSLLLLITQLQLTSINYPSQTNILP